MPVAKCLRSAVRSVFDQDSLSIESATADILRKYSTVSHQYDFTDLSTMYQDSAGTIPVTGVEQPIGKILDKAGTAHATQATSTKRPTLSAKYNLLLNSYSFNNVSYWTLSTGGVGSLPVVTPNAALNPFGTATDASLIVFNINGGTTSADLSQLNSTTISFTTGVQYVGSIWAKTSDGSTVVMKLVNPDATIFQSITITPVWTRHVITTTASLTTTGTFRLRLRGNESTSSSASVYVYAADLRTPASTPTTVPLYQHTTSATVYDTVGFPTYAKFDGVDDALVTSSIDFTGSDSVAHFTGIAKLSDAAAGIVYEFSADVNTNNGSFHVSAPVAASASIGVSSKGTTLVSASNTGFASPYISALSSSMDISTPLAQVIVNNSTTISSSSSQGTGNYGNYALYIGSRGGTSVPFNGRISTITLIGATITSPETRILETFTNNKLGKVY